MKILITILTFITLLTTTSTLAENTKHNHESMALEQASMSENTDFKGVINVKVNGLVCDFCARALEKMFSKRKEVNSIDVDLDNGLVKVYVKQGHNIDDETLTKLITDSGYNVISINKEY